MIAKDFRTRTIFEKTPASGRDDKWIIGLDVGYSAVKGMSANALYCFPSYAKPIPEDRITLKGAESTDIKYRDSKGTWAVGNIAYNEANDSDVMDSEEEMYGKNWIYSDKYKVIASVGLAMGLDVNSFGNPAGKEIIVQTGFPPQYIKSMESDLKEVISGDYDFEIQVGGGSWKRYTFSIKEQNVYVIAQPLGALISASIDKRGKITPESQKYFSSNLIVFDPGFVTVDDYTVHRGNVIGENTYANLGMCEVFKRTCKDIMDKFHYETRITELQSRLEVGTIKITDKKAMKSKLYDFTEDLKKNCTVICDEVIEKMKSVHNYFAKTDYIIATGGTYEAWKDQFNKVFEEMDGLKIIPANINEPNISNIFSNVRGYYYYRLNK